jgi:hypothetical protein
VEGQTRLGRIAEQEPGGLGLLNDQRPVGGPLAGGDIQLGLEPLGLGAERVELLLDHRAKALRAPGRVGEEAGVVLPLERVGHVLRATERRDQVVRRVGLAERVADPGHPGRGRLLEPIDAVGKAEQANRLGELRLAPPAGLVERAREVFPARDQVEAALRGPAEEAAGARGIGVEQGDLLRHLVLALVVPVVARGANLPVDLGVVCGVAAVGEEGGAHALVHEVLRGGAVGLVILVPDRGARRRDRGVLVGHRCGPGAEAVLPGIEPGTDLAGRGPGAGRLRAVGAAGRAALRGRFRHERARGGAWLRERLRADLHPARVSPCFTIVARPGSVPRIAGSPASLL